MKYTYIKTYKITFMLKEWEENISKSNPFSVMDGKKELRLKHPAALIKYISSSKQKL